MQAFFNPTHPMFKQLSLICLLLLTNISLANTNKQQHLYLQNIFQQGLNALHQANYQEAIVLFRKMLKNNPNLLRPRLELARSLYKNGDYESAKYHFEQVLSSTTLPFAVRKNVNIFLTRIRQSLPTFNLSLNLSLDQKIPSKKIGIFTFDDTDVRQHSYNFAMDTKIPINPKKRTFAKFKIEHNDINGSNNATTYLKTTLGKHYLLNKNNTLTPEIGFGHLRYQDQKLYNSKIFSLRYFKPLSRADYLNITYNYQTIDYIKRYKTRIGSKNKLSFGFTKLPSISSRFDVLLDLSKTNAQAKYNSFKGIGLNLSYNQDISNAFNMGISFKKNLSFYQAPRFGIKQKEKRTTVELSMLNRLWSIDNITPKLFIGKTKNSSNLYDYGKSDAYVRLEFTQKF